MQGVAAQVPVQPVSPLRRAAGSLEAQPRLRGVLLRSVLFVDMAASMAPRCSALLWAGAAWLRQRGIGELLQPRIERSTPGRDFSLSHYQVRAGWGVGSYTVGTGVLFVPD